MNVIPLEVFVSLILGLSSLILFVFACRQRDFEQSDRLSLLPIEDEHTALDSDRSTPSRGAAPHVK